MVAEADEPGISVDEVEHLTPESASARGLRHAGRAFRHRDFTLFWSGAAISNIGTFMQNAVVPFVLFELTHSGLWVGLSAFVLLAPGVVMGPIAGVLADRYSRKKLIMVMQTISAALAMGLWLAWVSGVRSPGAIVGLVGVNGFVWGLTIPSWQGFIAELVPREDLLSAVSLNSAQFSGSRAFGPALAGVALAAGPSWAFLINALSFAAVVVAVGLTHTPPPVVREGPMEMWRPIREGMAYVKGQRTIITCMGTVVLVAFLGQPVTQIIAVLARDTFHVGSGTYGLLQGANGLGAVVGAAIIATIGGRTAGSRIAVVGVGGMGLALLAVASAPTWPIAMLAMAFGGLFFMIVTSTMITTVQLVVPDELRGRAVGVYIMAFTAAYPLGSLFQGWLVDQIGPRANEGLAGGLLVFACVVLLLRRDLLAALDVD